MSFPKLPFETATSEVVSLGPVTMSRTVYELAAHIGEAALTVLLAIILLRLVPVIERLVIWRAKKSGGDHPDESSAELSQRVETLTRVTGSVLRALIWSVMLIVLLGIVGIPVAPLITGAGIVGVALGFGAQSIVKDFFAGFFILLKNQFGVGDTVTVAGVTGTVEQMTLRITVLRDPNGTAHFIPNSSITIVSNKTLGWVRVMLDTAFNAEVPDETARATLKAAAEKVSQEPGHEVTLIEPVKIEGPLELTGGAVTYRLSVKAHADHAAGARRELISALRIELEAQGLRYEGAMIVRRAK